MRTHKQHRRSRKRRIFPRITGKNALVALVLALAAFFLVKFLLPDELSFGAQVMALSFGLIGAWIFWFFYSRWAFIPEDPRDGATLPDRSTAESRA